MMVKAGGEGVMEEATPSGLSGLLTAFRRKDVAVHAGLSMSQAQNREQVLGTGKVGGSANADRVAECRDLFDSLECPVTCLREV